VADDLRHALVAGLLEAPPRRGQVEAVADAKDEAVRVEERRRADALHQRGDRTTRIPLRRSRSAFSVASRCDTSSGSGEKTS